MLSLSRFFGLVTALTTPFYMLGFAGKALSRHMPAQMPASALAFVVPAASALLLTPPQKRQKLVRQLWDRRGIALRWWLFTFGLMPAVIWISWAVQHLTGLNGLGDSLHPVPVALSFFVYLIPAACEELGWTGYAAPKLLRHYSPLHTGLLLGLFWAAWHVIPYVQTGHGWSWVWGQCAASVALRVVMQWLYLKTGGNVLVATVFHTMINVSELGVSHYSPWITAGVAGSLAAGLTLVNKEMLFPPHSCG